MANAYNCFRHNSFLYRGLNIDVYIGGRDIARPSYIVTTNECIVTVLKTVT